MSNTVIRKDGPEGVTYLDFHYKTEWGKQSVLHREDGPAIVEYLTETDEVLAHFYYVDGVMHRLDGPAFEPFWDKENEGGGPAYFVYGDDLETAMLSARSAGVITDEQLKEIQAKVSEAEQLITFAEALERNNG